MTLESTAMFALIFLLLAVTPGAGLAVILSRALSAGVPAGALVTAGMVLGDFVFLALAIVGLSALATAMGPLFQVVKYLAAAYLLWLGYKAFVSAGQPVTLQASAARPWWQEIGLGFFVTLGNPKPLLFYGALLPSVVDISRVHLLDYTLLCAVVVVISVAVYGGYLFAAERARRLIGSSRATRRLNQATGCMFVATGVWVAGR
jgi:threonine/homoserine/homoserine lactone efflux protein